MGNDRTKEHSFKPGSIILMAGLQGSGKTTTIAKLAYYIQSQSDKTKVFATSIDFTRPAAIEQLEILAEKGKFNYIPPQENSIIKTIRHAVTTFKEQKGTHLFVDTSGRIHIDNSLMTELQEAMTALQPSHKILVLDSMTGQESVNVAQAFDQLINISGSILSKADSDSRGGAALSFFKGIGKPILFLGTGERKKDLEAFIPERIASRMIGEGDVQTLAEQLEKAAEARGINQESQNSKLISGNFNLEDFCEQLNMFSSLGSMQKIISYMPGMGTISKEQIQKGEEELKMVKTLINSMTTKERQKPNIINLSRKKRIARGAGSSIGNIDQLLNKFEESKRFAKLLGKGKSLKDIFSGRL
jgi:signal recognition particle subunit SRP54